jgi:hypothetical protein
MMVIKPQESVFIGDFAIRTFKGVAWRLACCDHDKTTVWDGKT